MARVDYALLSGSLAAPPHFISDTESARIITSEKATMNAPPPFDGALTWSSRQT